jgi:four helix bundle protein
VKRKHHELKVWQDAMTLAKEIYRFTENFPKDEAYGLTSQIRRAAVSVPSNIAEGAGRNGNREFLKFLYIARGSLSELETQLILAKDIGYLADNTKLVQGIDTLFGLLGGLINSIQKREHA